MADEVDLTDELSFAIRAIFLSSTRVKALQTKTSSFSLQISYIRFEIWCHQDQQAIVSG